MYILKFVVPRGSLPECSGTSAFHRLVLSDAGWFEVLALPRGTFEFPIPARYHPRAAVVVRVITSSAAPNDRWTVGTTEMLP